MSDAAPTPPPQAANREEWFAALFAQLVVQQANLAMMLLGQAPNPETGTVERDLDGARFLIDQLEMLEAKTKGNLGKEEQALLKQTLMSLRLAFVEAVRSSETPPAKSPTAPSQPAEPAPAPDDKTSAAPSPGAEETKIKFSKKY